MPLSTRDGLEPFRARLQRARRDQCAAPGFCRDIIRRAMVRMDEALRKEKLTAQMLCRSMTNSFRGASIRSRGDDRSCPQSDDRRAASFIELAVPLQVDARPRKIGTRRIEGCADPSFASSDLI